MQFTNLNIFSIIIFIFFLLIIIYLGYNKYYYQINFNKKYNLLSSLEKFYIKYFFLGLSFIIILFGIFGIELNMKIENVENNGVDIIFVLDVSKSMNVYDIKDGNYNYTRLDVAKKSISDFINKNSNNRFGLVIFAGDAVSTVPLTTDVSLFSTFLENVDYRNLTVQGSDFDKAISLGVERFNISEEKNKMLVLVSDGGDENSHLSSTLLDTNKKISFAVVGIGTKTGGKIIKGLDPLQRKIYQKYNGVDVISKLNSENLKNIADKLNGEYFELTEISDLGNLNNSINKLEKKVIKIGSSLEKNNLSRILALISFILFLIYLIFYIFERRKGTKL